MVNQKKMQKVSAHSREWCSVSVFLEGHKDAQMQFLRWLKKTNLPLLEVTGPALAVLRGAGVIKARAPVGTLVAIEDIKTIARDYNSRDPKHKVSAVLDGLIWKGTVVLENPPPIKKNGKEFAFDDDGGETETKKVKQARDFTELSSVLGDDWEGLLDSQQVDESFALFGTEDTKEPMARTAVPWYALANIPSWIVCAGLVQDNSINLQAPYQIQKLARSEDMTSILLPAMPAGIVVSLVINEITYLVTVASEEVTNSLFKELGMKTQ